MARKKKAHGVADLPDEPEDGAADENVAAGVGHNKPPLTPEQEQALFFNNLRKVRGLKEEMASVSGELRAAFKTAKADGFTKKEIDFALALEKDKNGKVAEQRRREQQIAVWMQHPIGMQPDMFDQQPDRTPLEDRAYAFGKVAGMEDAPNDPPHDTASVAGQRWIEGWYAGSAARFDVLRLRDAAEFDGEPPPLGGEEADFVEETSNEA